MMKSKAFGQDLDRRKVLGIAGMAAAAPLLPMKAEAAAAPNLRPGARSLPASFLWGVSTSGHQTEGNNINADSWLMENVKPTLFEERSGDACDSINRYREDIDLIKSFGFNSYRFSLEWARIEPNEGQFSIAALDHYKRMISYCHKVGIRPCVTFNHYTTPIWFAASGGFLRTDGPELFARFCRKAAEHLADGMHYAFTLNEPEASRIIDLIFEGKLREPTAAMAAAAARAAGSDRFETWKTSDPEALLQPLIKAHKLGYAAIKSVRSDLPTGVCLATIDFRAAGANSLVASVHQKIDGAWLDAAKTGDFIGIQNYFPIYVDAKGVAPPPAGSQVDAFGVQIDPTSLANCARQVHAATGKPILVTENGMMTDDDAQRIHHTVGTLAALGRVMDEGVPLLGYMHWSLLDNYEWGSYKPKFGIVAVDRTTFQRRPKPSAYAIGAYARRNRL